MGDLEIYCSDGIKQESSRVDDVFDWEVVQDPVTPQGSLYWVCGKSDEGIYSENVHDEKGRLIYYREIDTTMIPNCSGLDYKSFLRATKGFRGGFVRNMQKMLNGVIRD